LGITWETFLDLTPRELYTALRFKAKEDENNTNMVKLMVDTVRTGFTHMYNLHFNLNSKTKKEIKPEKFMPMGWDREEVSPEMLKHKLKAMAQVREVEDWRKKETPEERHIRIENRRRNKRRK
jgi:hypothetical protein